MQRFVGADVSLAKKEGALSLWKQQQERACYPVLNSRAIEVGGNHPGTIRYDTYILTDLPQLTRDSSCLSPCASAVRAAAVLHSVRQADLGALANGLEHAGVESLARTRPNGCEGWKREGYG
ncbi:hypothetical protein DPSP01_003611 [Paraphaeosphaeria sporulosa]